MAGLKRVRDKLLGDLRALQKDRPRADDEARLSELSRLESALQVARDDLVRLSPRLCLCEVVELMVACSRR